MNIIKNSISIITIYMDKILAGIVTFFNTTLIRKLDMLKSTIKYYVILLYTVPFAFSVSWLSTMIYNHFFTDGATQATLTELMFSVGVVGNEVAVSKNVPVAAIAVSFLLSIAFIILGVAYGKRVTKREGKKYSFRSFISYVEIFTISLMLAISLSWAGSLSEKVISESLINNNSHYLWIVNLIILFSAFFLLKTSKSWLLKLTLLFIVQSVIAWLVASYPNQTTILLFYCAVFMFSAIIFVNTYKKYLYPKNYHPIKNKLDETIRHLIVPLSSSNAWKPTAPENTNEQYYTHGEAVKVVLKRLEKTLTIEKNIGELQKALVIEMPQKLKEPIDDISKEFEQFLSQYNACNVQKALLLDMLICLFKSENWKIFKSLAESITANNEFDVDKLKSWKEVNNKAVNVVKCYESSEQENKKQNDETKEVIARQELLAEQLTFLVAFFGQFNCIEKPPISALFVLLAQYLGLQENWVMPLIGLERYLINNKKQLKQVTFILSKSDSPKEDSSNERKNKVYGSYLQRFTFANLVKLMLQQYEADTVVQFCWANKDDNLSEPFEVKSLSEVTKFGSKAGLGDTKGVDFDSFENQSDMISWVLDTNRGLFNEREVVIDFTGGKKFTSVVSVFYATTTKVKNQSVDTNTYQQGTFDFSYYDATKI